MSSYLAPASFITWGPWSDHKMSRRGNYTITPINNQYSSELYWAYTYWKDGSYIACAYNHKEINYASPPMNEEVKAIRWLERKLKGLANKKINEANKKLAKQIEDNQNYLDKLDSMDGGAKPAYLSHQLSYQAAR